VIDISIIVVSWNSAQYLPACLSSLAAGAGRLSYETFVVDNGSRDGSAELVRAAFPWACLIANSANRGFAVANNQALRQARGRYMLLLNPDTKVHDQAIEKVVRFMDERPGTAACGCLLLNEDGSPQHTVRRFPTFSYALASRTILGRLGFFRRSYDRVRMRGEVFDRIMEVDQPSGAALFLRQDALARVGLLDEGYFLFFEEVDLCRRIRDRGYIIHLFPEAQITHFGGGSRHQNRALTLRVSAESLLRYFRAHGGRLRSALFELIFRPLFALGILVDAGRAGLGAARVRLWPRDPGRDAAREMLFRSYCEFIRRGLFPFLMQLWE